MWSLAREINLHPQRQSNTSSKTQLFPAQAISSVIYLQHYSYLNQISEDMLFQTEALYFSVAVLITKEMGKSWLS